MHTCVNNMSLQVTCPLLGELLASAVTTDQAGENKPNVPRLTAALHNYAQSQLVDRMYVPLPDNGNLMKDWLKRASDYQARRIEYMAPEKFAALYPERAIMVPQAAELADPALIDARA